jgi:hypothetical protein
LLTVWDVVGIQQEAWRRVRGSDYVREHVGEFIRDAELYLHPWRRDEIAKRDGLTDNEVRTIVYDLCAHARALETEIFRAQWSRRTNWAFPRRIADPPVARKPPPWRPASLRDREIFAERKGGVSTRELAMKYGISRNRVYEICHKEARNADREQRHAAKAMRRAVFARVDASQPSDPRGKWLEFTPWDSL